jgi:hypothetical protein
MPKKAAADNGHTAPAKRFDLIIDITIEHLHLHTCLDGAAKPQLTFACTGSDKRYGQQSDVVYRTGFGAVSPCQRQRRERDDNSVYLDGGCLDASGGDGGVIVRWEEQKTFTVVLANYRQRLAISCFDYASSEGGEGGKEHQMWKEKERGRTPCTNETRSDPVPERRRAWAPLVGSACVKAARLVEGRMEVELKSSDGSAVGSLQLWLQQVAPSTVSCS